MENLYVILKSFNGKSIAPKKTIERENYWKLIGEKGKIIDNKEVFNERVLVLFEKDLDNFNLENHNPIKNSLYILKTDLEIILPENPKFSLE